MILRLSLLPMLLTPLVCAAEGLQPGTQALYRGTIAPLAKDRSPQEPQKTFDLVLLVADAADGHRLYWTLEERGRGAWPWTERFGSVAVDRLWRKAEQAGPALLYDLGEAKSAVAITLPLLATEQPLTAALEWEEGTLKHVVQKATKLNEQDVWQVQASNNYGPKRTVWVAKESPLAVGLNERVFMGMGQEFQLELRLSGTETLPAGQLEQTVAAFDSLLELRGRLNLPTRKEMIELNTPQRTLLAQRLPMVEEQSASTPLEKIVRAAKRDVGQQTDRAEAVSKLAAEQTGRAVPEFAVEGLNDESISQQDLQGHVTVLHFWDYRDAPLQEPYGQIGYLDFLAQRRSSEGVKVYGVAVDGRLGEEAQRSQAVRGIRKLKSFMNLSYPILLDAGSLIRKFGDPRPAGAELPLFIVVAPDGKIVHYHCGLYEVDRNEGLRELSAAVSKALGK